MATTKVRTSSQVYVDASLDVNSNKIVNLSPGTVSGDAVEYAQMNSAISAALTGGATSLHTPVADLAAAKAVASAARADKMIMNIETLGLYRFDNESVVASNDGNVIRPTDIGSDASAGRWIQMTALTSDHNLTQNKQGGTTGEYYHLSSAELAKLGGIAAGADVTTAASVAGVIQAAGAKATPVDADVLALNDSASSWALKNFTFTNLKAFLKTYFDGLYQSSSMEDASGGYVGLTLFKINFKNAANTITSFFTNANTVARTYTYQDRSGTIADDTDITASKARANHTGTQLASTVSDFATAALIAAPAETQATVGTLISAATAKAAPVDADSIGVSDSAASNALKKFTFGNLKTYLAAWFSGDATVSATGVVAIGANKVTNAQLAQMATQTFKGRTTAATGNAEDLTVTQVKAMLGISTRVYRATPTGTVNGSNTAFTISALVISGTEKVYLNGILLQAGAGNDYTIAYSATTTITMLTAPKSTPFVDVLMVDYSY